VYGPAQKQQRNAQADALLARLTPEQLRAGLRRGLGQLALLNAELQRPPGDDFEGPWPPTKNYEKWSADHDTYMRNHLNSAVKDVRAELQRRGLPE
jgi:hypothetical protein